MDRKGDAPAPRRWAGSIGFRVGAAIAVVLVAVAVTASTAIWALDETEKSASDAVAEASDEAIPLLRLADDVNEMVRLLGGIVSAPSVRADLEEELRAGITRIDTGIENLEGRDLSEERVLFEQGVREWRTVTEALDPVLAGGDLQFEDPAVLGLFTQLTQTAKYFRTAHDLALDDVSEELAILRDRQHRAVLLMVITALAALAVGLLVALRLRRTLVRPIRRLHEAISDVATGERAGPSVAGGPRELAELSSAFDEMAADLRRREADLVHHAYHDPLTGLGNRALLRDRLDHALAQLRRREGEQLALYVVDVDGFKKVNDSLGHPSGDEALALVSRQIAACLREGDTLCRLGGDEFAVIAENIGDATFELGTRIREALREPFEVGGREVVLSASVGVAQAEHGLESPVELLRDADLAMYDAKKRGGDAVRYFESRLFERATARLEQEAALRQALARGELRVHYQPTIDLRSRRAEGVEALVRWQHPEQGLLPPGMFLPLAEQTGLDAPLGWHVLRTALADVHGWLDRTPSLEPFTVAVNISAGQLATRDFVDQVRDALAESGMDGDHLVLEITETSVLLDREDVRNKVAAVRRMGVRIALDDFGTGYSSLQHLQHYPVDIVKIDRSFVSDLARRTDLMTLVRAILELARAYGLSVVAEGVEDAEAAATLTDLGCPLGQGYWFARPAPREVIEDLLVTKPRETERREVGIANVAGT